MIATTAMYVRAKSASQLAKLERANTSNFDLKREKMNENFKMIGQGGWDVYVTGANGFVGKDGVVKGGLFDAQTGNPWCHKDCSRFHPTEVLKMVSY